MLDEAIDSFGPKAWYALAKRAKQFLDLPFTKERFPKLQILGFEIITQTLSTKIEPLSEII